MKGLEWLLERVSRPVLAEPGPTDEQLDMMFRAALRAPDHARLRPWRFMTVSGESRQALGEVLASVALKEQSDLSKEAINRTRGLPLRAPTLVLAICRTRAHAKVPVLEQQLSTAAAVQSLLLAAHAQGVGAIWRTGSLCYHPLLAEKLGLQEGEQLLGFIYLGTPAGPVKKAEPLPVSEFVTEWMG